MCYHRSFIVTENAKVLGGSYSDHHTDIRREHGIREEGMHATMSHCAVECLPRETLWHPETYQKVVDQEVKPRWWSDEHWKAVMDKLNSDTKLRANVAAKIYKFSGDIEVPTLEHIDPGSVIVSGGTIFFGSIHKFTAVTLVAKKIKIDATRLRYMDDCNFICDQFESNDPRVREFLLSKDQLTIRQSRRRFSTYPEMEAMGMNMYGMPTGFQSVTYKP